MTPIVDIGALQTGYGKHIVLEEVDLVVGAGEVLVVVGANGAGKSTLLRSLASLQPAVFEHATIAGHRLGGQGARAAASFAGDEPVFFTDISIVEQLDYLASLGDAGDPDEHVDAIIELLGLEERRDDIPTTMSRGWRQRAALACALARGAPLLCVDEPLVGLDQAGRDQLVAALDWYRGGDRAIVVATHDAPALDALAPRILEIEGR